MEEFKATIPRAGPKYRLGMYFETIHDLSEFEDISSPEDGYSSCWETETEFDSELNKFVFHNVTGDSASVICLDEAMELLALREQQEQQLKQQKEMTDGGELTIPGSGHLQEYALDQQPGHLSENKRSSGGSRHSHHSGSDGTYDGPQQAQIHTTHLPLPSCATTHQVDPDQHIYETLDDYQEHFQVYIGSKESGDSRDLAEKLPGHGSDNDSDKSSLTKRQGPVKALSFKCLFGKNHTSQTLEQQTALTKRERERQLKKNERGTQVAPKDYPLPVKGYSAEKPFSKQMSHEKVIASPSKTAVPSLVIKHKGKTYIIPVIDKKKEVKSKHQNSKRLQSVLYASTSAHTPAHPQQSHTLPKSIHSTFVTASTTNLKGHTSSVHMTETHDGVTVPNNRRRRSHQQSITSIAQSSKHSIASNKVTQYYGML